MNKTKLLKLMTTTYNDLERLLAKLDEATIAQARVVEEQTVKDLLAHIAAWAQLEIGWIKTALRGETVIRFAPSFEIGQGDDNETIMHRLNAHIYDQNKSKPLPEVLADFRKAHHDMITLVESLSAEDLFDPGRFAWWPDEPVWPTIAGNSYEHYQEHHDEIEDWLAAG